MTETLVAVLAGGAITLLSSLIGMRFQHRLELSRSRLAIKATPQDILYNKRLHFAEEVMPLYLRLREQGWNLNPQRAGNYKEWEEILEQELPGLKEIQTEFSALADHYQFYLPQSLLKSAFNLAFKAKYIPHDAAEEVEKAMTWNADVLDHISAFRDEVRDALGVDTLSDEFFHTLDWLAERSVPPVGE